MLGFFVPRIQTPGHPAQPGGVRSRMKLRFINARLTLSWTPNCKAEQCSAFLCLNLLQANAWHNPCSRYIFGLRPSCIADQKITKPE